MGLKTNQIKQKQLPKNTENKTFSQTFYRGSECLYMYMYMYVHIFYYRSIFWSVLCCIALPY